MPIEHRLKRWPCLLGVAAPLAILGSAPVWAAPVTIDFGTKGEASPSSPYQEDGFDVGGTNLFLSGFLGNPVHSIALDEFTPTLTISSIAGEPFSLLSLDSICLLNAGITCPNIFGVQGTLAGGGMTGVVTVSAGENWTTASAFAGFANLASLTISWVGPSSDFVDNIVLDVVPLPAALPLLATALAGLRLARQRRVPTCSSGDQGRRISD